MRNLKIVKARVRTQSRSQLIDVTEEVRALIRRKRVDDGLVIVYVPHTTAGVTINENADSDVRHDILAKLDALIPKDETYYRHAEGNSDSHLKASMFGSSVSVLIEGGKLVLGQWQGIYFAEFDGPRERDLLLKVVNLRRSEGH